MGKWERKTLNRERGVLGDLGKVGKEKPKEGEREEIK